MSQTQCTVELALHTQCAPSSTWCSLSMFCYAFYSTVSLAQIIFPAIGSNGVYGLKWHKEMFWYVLKVHRVKYKWMVAGKDAKLILHRAFVWELLIALYCIVSSDVIKI